MLAYIDRIISPPSSPKRNKRGSNRRHFSVLIDFGEASELVFKNNNTLMPFSSKNVIDALLRGIRNRQGKHKGREAAFTVKTIKSTVEVKTRQPMSSKRLVVIVELKLENPKRFLAFQKVHGCGDKFLKMNKLFLATFFSRPVRKNSFSEPAFLKNFFLYLTSLSCPRPAKKVSQTRKFENKLSFFLDGVIITFYFRLNPKMSYDIIMTAF